MAVKTDLELIAEFSNGNISSFEEIINRYSTKVLSLATRLTKNSEDAEEVLQDVFVTVFRKIAGFEGKSSFSSWLYRVTVNAAFMKLRKRRSASNQNISIEELYPQLQNAPEMRSKENDSGDKAALRSQVNKAIEEAIAALPEDYRPVFVLRDVDGLSSKEVSRILDITIPAVKSRLHRSRIMVKKRLTSLYMELYADERRVA